MTDKKKAMDQELKKDAIDLNGNVILTTEEEDARDRDVSLEELKQIKEDDGVTPSETPRIDESPKTEVKVKETNAEGKVEEKTKEFSQKKTPEFKEDTKGDAERKVDEDNKSIPTTTQTKVKEVKSGTTTTVIPEEEDFRIDLKEKKQRLNAGDPEHGQATTEEDSEKDAVDETAKKGADLENRISRMENMIAKIAKSITKSEDEEDADDESDEAEDKTEDAPEEKVIAEKSEIEVTETKTVEESTKADDSQSLQKVEQLSSTLEKVQNDLTIEKAAHDELKKSHDDLVLKYDALRKKAQPSKVMTPFAVAKGVQVFSEPKAQLEKVDARLKEIDNIRDNNVEAYRKDVNLQKEAYRLVKTRREIQEYLLPDEN